MICYRCYWQSSNTVTWYTLTSILIHVWIALLCNNHYQQLHVPPPPYYVDPATETVHKLYVCTHTSIVPWILALFRHTCRMKLIARSHHAQSGRFGWTYLSAIWVIAWRNYLTTSNYLSSTEGDGQILLSAIRSISWHVWDALRPAMYKHLMFSRSWLGPLRNWNLADTAYIVWIVVRFV